MLIGGCESGRRFCNLLGFRSLVELAPSEVALDEAVTVVSEDSSRGKLFLTDFLHDFDRFTFSSLLGSFSMLSMMTESAPTSVSGELR
jgi:hypothetical protein